MLLLSLLLLTACGRAPQPVASAEPLSASIALSTNVIRIGDAVTATVTVDHPAGSTVDVPQPGPDPEIVLRDLKTQTEDIAPDQRRTIMSCSLTSFRVGEHVVATGSVQCALADGRFLEKSLPEVRLAVQTVLVDPETPMRDIKGPVRWPATVPRWVWALAVVAATAAALSAAAARLVARPPAALAGPPPPPPHEVALAALVALMQKGWIESDSVEPFYVELSRIVRRYIEDRFGLRAPEQTTEEFIRDAAASRRLSAEHQQLVHGFLEQSDLVKFARHHPASDDMRAAHAAAERLVRETTPQPGVEPAQGEMQCR